MRFSLVIVLPLLATGCMTPPTWHKDGSSQEDFYTDQGQCRAQAFSAANQNALGVIYNSCMQGKGWRLYRDQ